MPPLPVALAYGPLPKCPQETHSPRGPPPRHPPPPPQKSRLQGRRWSFGGTPPARVRCPAPHAAHAGFRPPWHGCRRASARQSCVRATVTRAASIACDRAGSAMGSVHYPGSLGSHQRLPRPAHPRPTSLHTLGHAPRYNPNLGWCGDVGGDEGVDSSSRSRRDR